MLAIKLSGADSAMESLEISGPIVKELKIAPESNNRTKYVVGFLTSALSMVGLVAMWKIAALFMSEQDFAAFAICRRSMSALLPFIECGLPLAITQYASIEFFHTRKNREGNVLLAAVLWSSLFGAISFVACVSFGERFVRFFGLSPELAPCLPWVALWSFSGALCGTIMGWCDAKKNFLASNATIVFLFAIPLPILALSELSLPLRVALVGIATSIGFLTIIAYLLLKSRKQITKSVLATYLKKSMVYGAPRSISRASLQMTLWIPVALVAKTEGETKGAYVAFGMALITLAGGLARPMGTMSHSMFSVASFQGKNSVVRIRALQLLAATILFGTVGLLLSQLLLPQIIRFFLSDSYLAAVPILRLLLIAQIPFIVCIVMRSVLDAIEARPLDLRNGLVSLASLLLICFFWQDSKTVAIAFICALSLRAVLIGNDVWRNIKMRCLQPESTLLEGGDTETIHGR